MIVTEARGTGKFFTSRNTYLRLYSSSDVIHTRLREGGPFSFCALGYPLFQEHELTPETCEQVSISASHPQGKTFHPPWGRVAPLCSFGHLLGEVAKAYFSLLWYCFYIGGSIDGSGHSVDHWNES
jgi:hypothetical protein